MIGVGIDIVDLEGFRPHDGGDCFQPEEVSYASTKARPNQHLAARYAAKRAARKALGGGDPGEIEVIHTDGGGVDLRLTGTTLERAEELGFRRCLVSLSHTSRRAGALVVFDNREETR
ncbi:MAG: 4'-phosphopantetheinyl transferase superfamily protein [Planctomycetota bacterium]|jgi:holo-[acyl-carrier protein] synthase